jgi:sulfate adenylyltransferase large subunit
MNNPSLQEVGPALRVMTAGSVDDGKSTLIGRLLYELGQISEDIVEDLRASSLRMGRGELDLSLFTDGLLAEREQGITIDVAYRYFHYLGRSFVLCDAPGHVQYTRNMVCAASQSDVALILVDARQGITEQTQRHARIAQMLGVSALVYVINKMDLVEYSQERFKQLRSDVLNLGSGSVVPVSALHGDHLVQAKSLSMPWYDGPSVIDLLMGLPGRGRFIREAPLRFVVQTVLRASGHDGGLLHDFRGLAGRVESGSLTVGGEVTVLSGGGTPVSARIERLLLGDSELSHALAGQSITVILDTDVDAPRGSILVEPTDAQARAQAIESIWCWMSDQPARRGQRLLLRQGATTVQAKLVEIGQRLDLETGRFVQVDAELPLEANQIARLTLHTAQPLLTDRYSMLPQTGSLIALDPQSFDTLGAGVIG